MNIRKKIQQLDSIYAKLPKLECKGLCAESCGPIVPSDAEYARIVKRVGSEIDFLVETCPLLQHGKCTIYDIRPMLCRQFGMVEAMRCPFGCEPERMLGRAEGYELLGAVS